MNKIQLSKYVSRLKRDQAYKNIVDEVIYTLSESLDIPIHELYNGLFFTKGKAVKGILTIEANTSDKAIKEMREYWHKMILDYPYKKESK